MIHKAARASGILGFFAVAAVLLAAFDAFTQIWVTRPGYEGMPIIAALGVLAMTSLASLSLAVLIRTRFGSTSDTRPLGD
jgi:phosphatidylserine synthase